MSDHHAAPPLMEDALIKQIAAAKGKSTSHILLRWGLQRPTVVIPKSVTPSRIASNAELFDFELSAEEMAQITALDKQGLEGCYNHPKTPWLGRGEFTGSTSHYNSAKEVVRHFAVCVLNPDDGSGVSAVCRMS
jgi:hypothetical protein